jgi:hypothetical protein
MISFSNINKQYLGALSVSPKLWTGRRFHSPNLPLALFHHKSPVCAITDIQPAIHDNNDRIAESRRVPVARDGYSSPQEIAPKALFDNSTVTRKVC